MHRARCTTRDLDGHRHPVLEADLLAGDVSHRPVDFVQCLLSGRATIGQLNTERNGDVAIVNPQIKDADLQEVAVRLRTNRCHRRFIDNRRVERLEIGDARVGDGSDCGGELVRRHRHRFLHEPGGDSKVEKVFRVGHPPRERFVDPDSVRNTRTDIPIGTQRLRGKLIVIEAGDHRREFVVGDAMGGGVVSKRRHGRRP